MGKEYVKAVYYHPAYLTYMQSTSWGYARLDEAQAGIKIAGRNKTIQGEISVTSEMQLTQPLWPKANRN